MNNGTKIIFLDTETSDIKPPTLIQLGYVLVVIDDTAPSGYRVIRELGTVLNRGPNLVMNKYAFAAHGITTAFCSEYGLTPEQVGGCLDYDLDLADVMICHNMPFDLRVLKNFALEVGYVTLIAGLEAVKTHCTMSTTKGFCGLLDKRGRAKNPKLIELYAELFNESFEGQHAALEDVRAMMRCYFALPTELQWSGV